MTRSTAAALLAILTYACAGCTTSSHDPPPSSIITPDGGPPGQDGGSMSADARPPGSDGGGSAHDAGAQPPSKGLWIWGSTIRGEEGAFVGWASQHAYTDVFVLIKDTAGDVKYDVLSAVLQARSSAPAALRVWAWLVGFDDSSHNPAWTYVEGDMVSPDDATYQSYLAGIVKSAVDPSLGNVPEPPDGVMLDDTFQWPGANYGGTTDNKVTTLMESVDAIEEQTAAVQSATGKTIHLGFSPYPNTTVVSSTSTTIVTDDAVDYGQDLGEIGKRCDWIAPWTFRYGYSSHPSSWIGQVVADIQKELVLEDETTASATAVYPALVLMQSDSDPTPVDPSDLGSDLASAEPAGGFGVYRYMSESANPGNDGDPEDLPTAAQEAVLDGTPPPPADAGAPDTSATVSNPLSPIVGYEQINLSDTCGSCGSHAGAICMGYFYGTSDVSVVTSIENDIYSNYGLPCGPGSSALAAAYTQYFANNNLPWSPVVFQDPSQVLGYLQSGSPVVAHTVQWGGHYVTVYGLVTDSSGATTVYFSDGAYDDGLNNTLPTGNLKQWDWSTFLNEAATLNDFIGFVHK